jgi:serine/threonine protein kinase
MTQQLTPKTQDAGAEGGSWDVDPLLGGMVGGRYRIRNVIGRGGMGVVYDAIHEELGRNVAIKVVSAAHAHDTKVIDRFLREARVVAQIGHPNIVDVHDLGRLEDKRPYLVMERLYGPSFYELLHMQGKMEPLRVAELLDGAAAALEIVHSKGIIHRDIKLENLMLARIEDGSQVVKLLDFGIAAFSSPNVDAKRITAQGMITGTPLYIAPEAASGDRPDHRADIYSLSVVAYMMLTGFAPFDSENPVMVLLKKLSEPPPPLSSESVKFSKELEDVIARGLSRNREERYQSARELVRDIRSAARVDAGQISQQPTAVQLTDVIERPKPVVFSDPTPLVVKPPPSSIEVSLVPETQPNVRAAAPVPVARTLKYQSTADLVAEMEQERDDKLRRAAFVAIPLLAIAAVIVVLSRGSSTSGRGEPITEPLPISQQQPARDPAQVLPVADPPVRAEKVEQPQEEPVAEAPKEETVLTRAEPAKEERVRKAPPIAEPVVRTAESQKIEQPDPPVQPRRKVVKEEPAPATTSAPTDLARAEKATREGMKALIGGRLPSAIESFREATNAAPKFAAAWRGLGLANEKMGRKSEALEAFEHYLRTSGSENPGVVREIESRVEKLKGL